MPTFPLHWAGISGSMEEDDGNPFEAAVRELQEKTNLGELFEKFQHDDDGSGDTRNIGLRSCIKEGLHVDVPTSRSKGAFGGGVIRVYPFALTLPTANSDSASSIWSNLQMKGTEHDQMQFIDINTQFLTMTEPCVPSLKLAFHHATSGSYLKVSPFNSNLLVNAHLTAVSKYCDPLVYELHSYHLKYENGSKTE